MSDLKLYRAKLKTRKQIMAEIPREHQGWWADVCAGETLELRDATEADLERCSLNRDAPRDPAEYLCENIERGSLVRRIAVAELTEITPRGLVAQHNETIALRARIKELEAELARRTQPEATAPAQKLTLENAPIGTKAPAIMGGAWTRTELGWKWDGGSTFPRPGGDWNGKLIAPAQDLSAAKRIDLGHGSYIEFERKTSGASGWLLRNEGGNLVRALSVTEVLLVDAALASSANSLSAGDRVDAELSKYLRHLPDCGSWVKEVDTYDENDMWSGTTNVSRPCTCGLDAILQFQKGGSDA